MIYEHEDGRPAENVRTVLLDSPQVLATTVNERGRPGPNWTLATLGGMSAAIGLVAGGLGLDMAGAVQGIVLLAALLLLVLGGIALYRAFDRPEGSIRVTITSGAGRETMFMPRSARDVAGEVSSVVSEGA